MTKYTLYARHGRLFNSDVHFLQIGDWLMFRPDMVILQHGMLSDAEYRQIKTQTLVNVYQHPSYHTISIVAPYDDKYFSRQPDPQRLTQYAGVLHRESDELFTGRIHVK